MTGKASQLGAWRRTGRRLSNWWGAGGAPLTDWGVVRQGHHSVERLAQLGQVMPCQQLSSSLHDRRCRPEQQAGPGEGGDREGGHQGWACGGGGSGQRQARLGAPPCTNLRRHPSIAQ